MIKLHTFDRLKQQAFTSLTRKMSNCVNDLILANESAALSHKLSYASKIWMTRREMPKLNWRGLPVIIMDIRTEI